jgi:hypothetical protein
MLVLVFRYHTIDDIHSDFNSRDLFVFELDTRQEGDNVVHVIEYIYEV